MYLLSASTDIAKPEPRSATGRQADPQEMSRYGPERRDVGRTQHSQVGGSNMLLKKAERTKHCLVHYVVVHSQEGICSHNCHVFTFMKPKVLLPLSQKFQ
jgi:hypothetical protein